MNWPFGLHHNGMHNFILDELELGTRVALAIDMESLGYGPLFDLQYEIYMRDHGEVEWR